MEKKREEKQRQSLFRFPRLVQNSCAQMTFLPQSLK
jgi:hypothetical protein